MRHLNKTNIRKALRKSYDDQNYYEVTDEWCARFEWTYCGERRARLWNIETGEERRTGALLMCSSMTELIDFATERLLAQSA